MSLISRSDLAVLQTKCTDIEVELNDKNITIEFVKCLRESLLLSEKELLRGLDAHTAHADRLAIVLGKEFGE